MIQENNNNEILYDWAKIPSNVNPYRMEASIVEEKREAHQLLERRKYRGQRRNS